MSGAMVDVEQIDKKLAGHAVNLNIARQSLDFERVSIISQLVDELLDLRAVTKVSQIAGGDNPIS